MKINLDLKLIVPLTWQLLQFMTNIFEKFDSNLITCSVSPDIKKAFDSVGHNILLKKIFHYGFRGKIGKLM